ncbi:MAG: glycosyltransferase family 4 protein [Actinomycetota bacterium]
MAHDRAPLRVFHLIHDLGPGGAEHVLVDLARVANGAGIEMTVVSMMPTTGLRYPEILRNLGVGVHSLELRAWWDPRGPGRLRRLIADLRPHLLHSHLKHADVVAGRVASSLSIPHVSTLHVIEDEVSVLGRLKRWVGARSRRRTAAMTIAVSDAQRQWYLDMSGEDPGRVVTLRNGVPDPGPTDLAVRAAVRRELGIGPEAVVATMVAVMRPGKGHDVLLDALPLFHDGIVVVLVGDGELAAEVRDRARRFEGRVIVTGFREDVPRLLAGSDLLIHPSQADALPTAVVQAAAGGLPVVASKVGGIPEIVTDESGILIPPGDRAGLALAVNRLAADPGARLLMGKVARERYEELFTSAIWLDGLLRVYEVALHNNR